MFHKFMFVRLFLLCFSLSFAGLSLADDLDLLPPVSIINSTDLQSDGTLAQQSQKPILILFAMQGCTYCQYVEEEHLKPMLRNATYRSKVIIRRVMTDSYGSIVDFNGERVSSQELSSRYGAYLTPTVVFVDHQGNKLVQSIHGVRNTEYYGQDLDEGLDRSLLTIRERLAAVQKSPRTNL